MLDADHLIHCRWHLAQSKQPLQLHDVEIGHTYAFHLPRLFESFHSLPTKQKGRLLINTNTTLMINFIVQELSPQQFLHLSLPYVFSIHFFWHLYLSTHSNTKQTGQLSQDSHRRTHTQK